MKSITMQSLLLTSLRGRALRVGLLAMAVLTVSAAFGLFLSASEATAVQVNEDLAQYWRTTYDILVRPSGSRTDIEAQYGLVESHHLSGIAGGITFGQYRTIRDIPGVEVAAPIAMLGYSLQHLQLPMDAYPTPGVYYLSCRSTEDDGARSYRTDHELFDYVGTDVRDIPMPEVYEAGLRPASHSPHCPFLIPLLLAAIAPEQEAALVGLDRSIDGDYLDSDTQITKRTLETPTGEKKTVYTLPALINATSYVSTTFSSELVQLVLPPEIGGLREILNRGGRTYIEELPWGQTVSSRSIITANAAYEQTLEELLDGRHKFSQFQQWRVPSPIAYLQITPPNTMAQDLVLEAVPLGVYHTMTGDPRAEDPQPAFRETASFPLENGFGFSFQGTFDIVALAPSSELSAVPLETYFPPYAVWRYDEAGEPVKARTLRPTLNPFGYIQTPPLVLTTLKAARALAGEDAISAVRVRVSGIDRFSSEAQVRIEAVASEIVRRTGLEVDVVVGSSPRPVLVHIPGVEVPGEGNQDIAPLGYVEERWIQKGVGLTTHDKVQWTNVLLFGALLIVCTTFILNATTTTVLGRMQEFGLLKALGWRTTSLAQLVLSEGLLVGFVAGGVGVALAVGLATGLGLALPLERAVLVWPLGLLLCLLGYLYPALWAARIAPAAALKQGEVSQSSGQAPRWLGYAGRTLWRRRARALLSGAVVAAGAGMLTFLLSLLWGLRGYLTLTLLGQYVLMHVEGYHWAMVALILGVGALAVADTLLVGVAERRQEIGVLKTLGWRTEAVGRLFLIEGALLGLVGGLVGGIGGAAAYVGLYGVASWDLLPAIVGGVGMPVLVGAVAALYPAQVAARVPPAEALRYE